MRSVLATGGIDTEKTQDPIASRIVRGYGAAGTTPIFDLHRWAESLHKELGENAERLPAEARLSIGLIRELKAFRQKDSMRAILAQRGDRPKLVDIFSAMESCRYFQPWHP